MAQMITLQSFVKKCGTQEQAAQEIGVSFTTINRWLNGRRKPRGLAVKRLTDLGVKI